MERDHNIKQDGGIFPRPLLSLACFLNLKFQRFYLKSTEEWGHEPLGYKWEP